MIGLININTYCSSINCAPQNNIKYSDYYFPFLYSEEKDYHPVINEKVVKHNYNFFRFKLVYVRTNQNKRNSIYYASINCTDSAHHQLNICSKKNKNICYNEYQYTKTAVATTTIISDYDSWFRIIKKICRTDIDDWLN